MNCQRPRRAVTERSALSLTLQPPSWIKTWQGLQNKPVLASLVGPPLELATMWCTSHHWTGAVQPGNRQPPSRAISAVRSARLMGS